jgi:hypothetical protein
MPGVVTTSSERRARALPVTADRRAPLRTLQQA